MGIKKDLIASAAIVVTLSAHAVNAQQQFMEIPFPATQQTTVTDCTTPTVIDLGGGQKVTFEGGQFIRYSGPNFDGVMYASTSEGGCQRSSYGGITYYLTPSQPWGEIRVSFSPPVNTQIGLYNFVGDVQFLADQFWNAPNTPIASGGGTLLNQAPPLEIWTASLGAAVSAVALGTLKAGGYTEISQGLLYPSQWALGITVVRIPVTTPDVVKFDFSSTSPAEDGKVLLSKAPWDFNYFSQYQVRGASPPQVRISGTLLDGRTKQPKSGNVYLKVEDPKDGAPYRGGDANAGDNDGAAATLTGATNGVAKIQTDAHGHFETILAINSTVAGDNYQITGAPNDSFSCGAGTCPKSGVFTLWKRVYVEEEHMFRQGSFVSNVVTAGTTAIPVADPAPFSALSAGTPLQLVHADSGAGEGYYSEVVSFASLSQLPGGGWVVAVDPSTPIKRSYGAVPTGSAVDDIRRDGIGVVPAGVYEPNSIYTPGLLGSAFVDLVLESLPISEVPYVREIDNTQSTYYASRWLQDGALVNAYIRHPRPNVYHRFGSTQTPLVMLKGAVGAELGVTSVSGGTNNTFILVQRIEDLVAGRVFGPNNLQVGPVYNGLSLMAANGETTAHETVHLWVHQPLGSDGTGHCLQMSYRSNLECLMHEPYTGPGLADGLVDLHYTNHGGDSEYMIIRRAPDPVPQQ